MAKLRNPLLGMICAALMVPVVLFGVPLVDAYLLGGYSSPPSQTMSVRILTSRADFNDWYADSSRRVAQGLEPHPARLLDGFVPQFKGFARAMLANAMAIDPSVSTGLLAQTAAALGQISNRYPGRTARLYMGQDGLVHWDAASAGFGDRDAASSLAEMFYDDPASATRTNGDFGVVDPNSGVNTAPAAVLTIQLYQNPDDDGGTNFPAGGADGVNLEIRNRVKYNFGTVPQFTELDGGGMEISDNNSNNQQAVVFLLADTENTNYIYFHNAQVSNTAETGNQVSANGLPGGILVGYAKDLWIGDCETSQLQPAFTYIDNNTHGMFMVWENCVCQRNLVDDCFSGEQGPGDAGGFPLVLGEQWIINSHFDRSLRPGTGWGGGSPGNCVNFDQPTRAFVVGTYAHGGPGAGIQQSNAWGDLQMYGCIVEDVCNDPAVAPYGVSARVIDNCYLKVQEINVAAVDLATNDKGIVASITDSWIDRDDADDSDTSATGVHNAINTTTASTINVRRCVFTGFDRMLNDGGFTYADSIFSYGQPTFATNWVVENCLIWGTPRVFRLLNETYGGQVTFHNNTVKFYNSIAPLSAVAGFTALGAAPKPRSLSFVGNVVFQDNTSDTSTNWDMWSTGNSVKSPDWGGNFFWQLNTESPPFSSVDDLVTTNGQKYPTYLVGDHPYRLLDASSNGPAHWARFGPRTMPANIKGIPPYTLDVNSADANTTGTADTFILTGAGTNDSGLGASLMLVTGASTNAGAYKPITEWDFNTTTGGTRVTVVPGFSTDLGTNDKFIVLPSIAPVAGRIVYSDYRGSVLTLDAEKAPHDINNLLPGVFGPGQFLTDITTNAADNRQFGAKFGATRIGGAAGDSFLTAGTRSYNGQSHPAWYNRYVNIVGQFMKADTAIPRLIFDERSRGDRVR